MAVSSANRHRPAAGARPRWRRSAQLGEDVAVYLDGGPAQTAASPPRSSTSPTRDPARPARRRDRRSRPCARSSPRSSTGAAARPIRASSTCWSPASPRRSRFLATPLARLAAIRWRAVAKPRDRDVHAVAIPRMGGVALFVGFALALFVARPAADLARVVRTTARRFPWIVVAAGVICADRRARRQVRARLADQAGRAGARHRHHGHPRRRAARASSALPWAEQQHRRARHRPRHPGDDPVHRARRSTR